MYNEKVVMSTNAFGGSETGMVTSSKMTSATSRLQYQIAAFIVSSDTFEGIYAYCEQSCAFTKSFRVDGSRRVIIEYGTRSII